MEPYHNEGFGISFLLIVVFTLILPALIMLSIDDGFGKLIKMRGGTGNCWENANHERVCKDNNTCKFFRNFC